MVKGNSMCIGCNPHLASVLRSIVSRRDFIGGAAAFAAAGPVWTTASAQSLPPTLAGREPADVIILGGPIVTVDELVPNAEAIAIRQGRISAVGTRDEVMAQRGPTTQILDLQGRTLLPGFVEPHMHTSMAIILTWLDVGPFTTKTVDEALAKIKAAAAATKDGAWVQAKSFDPSLMLGPPLTAALLDAVSPDRPVVVIESNGHIAYVNSLAFKAAGITKDTPNPPQGRFVRDASGALTGRLEEFPAFLPILAKIPQLTSREIVDNTHKVLATAAAAGCTALHDCGFGMLHGDADLALLQQVMSASPPVRLSGALVSTHMDDWIKAGIKPGAGDDRFRLTGIKAWSDGSNQARTGYQREPYLNSTTRGVLNYTPDQIRETLQRAHDLGWQLCVHANGDAAIDTTIAAYEAVLAKSPRNDHRHRIEHCSILHPEQIAKIKKLGLAPTFLIGHVYYWGRAFRDNILGPERTALLDPCASALKAGLRISLHSDYDVTPIEPLRFMQTAVTRVMRDGGEVLSPDERITQQQAIRAVTLDAAWQCRQDHMIGSLTVGKYADLVMLEDNPATVDPSRIASIKVNETWLEGAPRRPV
jgi:predicted amidohydrolase YtcJ